MIISDSDLNSSFYISSLEKFLSKFQSHIDQAYHHRHLHQRADDSREGGAGINAEDGNRNYKIENLHLKTVTTKHR